MSLDVPLVPMRRVGFECSSWGEDEKMIRIAIITNLIAYSIVASQPLFYILALGSAQRALSAAAYIELRQRINAVMSRRVSVIYLSTLATGLLVLVLSLRLGNWSSLAAVTVALLCLVIDIFFMVRENVPINGVIDQWSTADHPDDWESYRTKWFEIFAYRQVLLLVGFFALLVGAVFQP